MKKINTTPITTGSAMPFKSGSLEHLQSAYQETTIDTIQMLISQGDSEAYPTTLPPRIMYGCRYLSGIGAVSQGAIIYGNELYRTDGAVGIVLGLGQVVVGTITTTYFTATNADPVTFSDSTTNNVHEIKKITWAAGTSGSGDFDLDDCLIYNQWNSIAYNASYLSAQSGTWTIPAGAADWQVRWLQNGRTVTIDFSINDSNISASPTYLILDFPFNANFKEEHHALCWYNSSGSTPTSGAARVYSVAGTSQIRITPATLTVWGTDTLSTTRLRGQIICELEKADF